MDSVPLSLALAAGALSILNPCGFPLLPAFLSFYVGAERDTLPSPTNRAAQGLLVGRSEWDGSVLADRRVMHFWDETREVNRSLAPLVESRSRGGHPDEYFLFGPEAVWDVAPSGLRDTGQNILGRSGRTQGRRGQVVATGAVISERGAHHATPPRPCLVAW